jgi:hypothetical protein
MPEDAKDHPAEQSESGTKDEKDQLAASVQTDDASGDGKDPADKLYTRAELEKIVNDSVKERVARAQKKADEDKQRAAAAAKEQILKEQGDFKTLAEEREQKINELVPFQERAEKAEAALRALVDRELKDAPKHVQRLLADRSPAEAMDFINEFGDEWKKSASNGVGSGATSGTGKTLTREQREDLERRETRRIGSYF